MSTHIIMMYHNGIPLENILDKLYTGSIKPEIAIASSIPNQTKILMSFPNDCIIGNGLFKDWLSSRLDRHVFFRDDLYFVEMSSESPILTMYRKMKPTYKLGTV